MAWEGSEGLRAAASLVVAVGKLLMHVEGRLAAAPDSCGDHAADVVTAFAEIVLWVVCDVLWVGARAAGRDGGQPESWWEARRRVWVGAYGAWRWLPTLASVVQRATAARHVEQVDHVSLQPWWACLNWVRRLCLALCNAGVHGVGAGGVGWGRGGGGCGERGSGSGGRRRCCGRQRRVQLQLRAR